MSEEENKREEVDERSWKAVLVLLKVSSLKIDLGFAPKPREATCSQIVKSRSTESAGNKGPLYF